MTVAELITQLQQVENKDIPVQIIYVHNDELEVEMVTADHIDPSDTSDGAIQIGVFEL